MIAQFALRPSLGHREVRQDKCGELCVGELDGKRRRCRLWCRGAHDVRASCEEGCFAREHLGFSTYYKRLGPFAKLATSLWVVPWAGWYAGGILAVCCPTITERRRNSAHSCIRRGTRSAMQFYTIPS